MEKRQGASSLPIRQSIGVIDFHVQFLSHFSFPVIITFLSANKFPGWFMKIFDSLDRFMVMKDPKDVRK